MKIKIVEVVLVTFGLLIASNTFAGDLPFKMSVDNRRIEVSGDRLIPPTDPEEDVICEAETIGGMVCVLCEYTAIGETTFNCYAIPEPENNNTGDLEFSLKKQR